MRGSTSTTLTVYADLPNRHEFVKNEPRVLRGVRFCAKKVVQKVTHFLSMLKLDGEMDPTILVGPEALWSSAV